MRSRHLLLLAAIGAFTVGITDLPGVSAPVAEAAECGVEKWSIKTASDPQASEIDRTVVPTTIEQLRAIPRPQFVAAEQRYKPTETTSYRVTATLRQYKVEPDSDVHLVLVDPAGSTLITELAHPDCVSTTSPLRADIVNARNSFLASFAPTTNWKFSTQSVTVTGVGFFDYLHGQTGVAPNGIELHPMTAFAVGAAPAPTASPTPGETPASTASPTPDPTASPTSDPAATPTASPAPTQTTDPSASPTVTPSAAPAIAAVSVQANVAEITAGNKPVLTGTVTDTTGQRVAGTTVTVFQKAYGQAGYTQLSTWTTDADGRFTAGVGPLKQTAYVAQAGGVSSPNVVIRVHSRITVSSPVPGATVAARTTFTGSLNPVYPGVAMGLAVIRSGRYTYLGQGTVSSSGGWSITANLPAGTFPYVVYTSAHAGTLYGSKSLTLTVRASAPPSPPPSRNCDPSYPDVCIPPPPPDLDCGDISYRRFRVTGSDPHGFDADNDGVGCES